MHRSAFVTGLAATSSLQLSERGKLFDAMEGQTTTQQALFAALPRALIRP